MIERADGSEADLAGCSLARWVLHGLAAKVASPIATARVTQVCTENQGGKAIE
jgi:hypothetical protein